MCSKILKIKITLSKKEIYNLYRSGKKIHFSSFYVLWNFNKNLHDVPLRLVISVPKKKVKKAVDRNYIKRCIKEVFMLKRTEFSNQIVSPINLILVYNKSLLTEFNQLQEELLTLFKKISTEVNENY